jgi:hypothetical protein
MKKINYLLLLMCNCIFAQINYEKGYFIDNAGIKTECLIKNEDWKNNPNKFYFKTSEEAPGNFKIISSVKEFGVENYSKYERHEVLIDTSSSGLQNLSSNRNPEWAKKTLFLKLVVDGDAKLYEFADGMQKNFFYSFKGSKVEQLVYKEYILLSSGDLMRNKYYLQQLANTLKCNDTKRERIERIGYKLNDLTKYFIEVNNCDGNKAVTTINTIKGYSGFTNIKAKAGINFSKLILNTTYPNSNIYPVEFDNKIGANLGVEIEHVLGFNRNKWSVFYEPSFQTYKSEKRKIVPSNTPFDWKVDYKSIDNRFGIRHHMFLNNESRIFLSVGITYKHILGSPQITVKVNGTENENYRVDLESNIGYTVGMGFSYKKSDFEIRYSRPDIIATHVYLNSNYNTISVIYGYKIFDFKKKK